MLNNLGVCVCIHSYPKCKCISHTLLSVAFPAVPYSTLSHIQQNSRGKEIVLSKKYVFISVINQLDAQTLFYNKFISCFYIFRVHVFIIRMAVSCTRRPSTIGVMIPEAV